MKIEWLGHSSFCVEECGKTILIDPFLSGNPMYPEKSKISERKVDAIVLTHGHGDHLGDSEKIAKATGCKIFAIYEICCWLGSKGIANVEPMNTGGSVKLDNNIKVSLVNALHSSSMQKEDGTSLYLGCACGTVITGKTCTLYHSGDTDIFSDMALIQKIYKPDVGLLPIGDRFTMNPETAALACNEFLSLDVAIPMHYGTFPLLTGSPEEFAAKVKNAKVKVLSSGESFEYSRHEP